MSLRINPKKLVERQLSRYHAEQRMTPQEKIAKLLHDMEFNKRMYEKHDRHKNNRFDKKSLNFNQWTLISRIESIKKKVRIF
jgi:hypothetical protein